MKRHHTLAKHSKFDSRECKCISYRGNKINFSANCAKIACGEQTHFSALASPAEKIGLGEARAEKCVCSPQASVQRNILEKFRLFHYSSHEDVDGSTLPR